MMGLDLQDGQLLFSVGPAGRRTHVGQGPGGKELGTLGSEKVQSLDRGPD